MARFASQSQAKKFKPLLSSIRDSLHSPGDLSQSQHSKLQSQPSLCCIHSSIPIDWSSKYNQIQIPFWQEM